MNSALTKSVKIAVIGAGSMGCFIASKIRSKSPLSSTLGIFTSRQNIADTINKHGIRIELFDETIDKMTVVDSCPSISFFASSTADDFMNRFRLASNQNVSTNGTPSVSSHVDLVIIMTKGVAETALATELAVKLLKSTTVTALEGRSGWILSLQNGIGYYDVILNVLKAQYADIPVIVGSTSMGVSLNRSESSPTTSTTRTSTTPSISTSVTPNAFAGLLLRQSSSIGTTILVNSDDKTRPTNGCGRQSDNSNTGSDDDAKDKNTNINNMCTANGLTITEIQSLLMLCDMNVLIRPAEVRNNVLWSKLVVSATLLPMTVILNQPNGCLVTLSGDDVKHLVTVVHALQEICRLANTLGIVMEFVDIDSYKVNDAARVQTIRHTLALMPSNVLEELHATNQGMAALEHVLWVASTTATNISSMLSDIRNKRGHTESESILGPLIVLGERYEVPTPTLR